MIGLGEIVIVLGLVVYFIVLTLGVVFGVRFLMNRRGADGDQG